MKQLGKIFELLKIHWGYLAVASTIGASLLAYKANIEKKAVEKYTVEQSGVELKKNVDSLLKVLPGVAKGQEKILQELDNVKVAVGCLQASYIDFLSGNEQVNKDLYRKLTDGLQKIQDDIKKNLNPIP